MIEHHFTLRWARQTNICSCSWQSNLDSRVVWILKIFFTAKREKIQVRDYSHLRIPKQFQFQVLLHPQPPISDCFHPQSISDTPAAPGTFISEPTISHQEGGDRLLSDFSVPISYPLSMTLKALEMDKADPPGVQEHDQDEDPQTPGAQLSSRPFFPAEALPGVEVGKIRPCRWGLWSGPQPLCTALNTTLQNPAAPAHIFKLTYKIFLDKCNRHKGYNYQKIVHTNF